MKIVSLFRLFIITYILFSSHNSLAQNQQNWTRKQLMEPGILAQILKNQKDLPVIYNVGPDPIIPTSIDIGAMTEEENIVRFKNGLAKLSKQTKIVVYCGCCPYKHCPNVRPAIAALKEMKFTNYYLLDLPQNIKKDWINKGYPVVKK